jgi:hypothetical protein
MILPNLMLNGVTGRLEYKKEKTEYPLIDLDDVYSNDSGILPCLILAF